MKEDYGIGKMEIWNIVKFLHFFSKLINGSNIENNFEDAMLYIKKKYLSFIAEYIYY